MTHPLVGRSPPRGSHSTDPRTMTSEEYERIKEAEKERLRAAKTLRSMQQTLRRQQALRSAVEKIAGAQQALENSEALTDRLAYETARSEARLDLALEAGRALENVAPPEDTPSAEANSDEDYEAEQARATVRQFKQALGLTSASAPDRSPAADTSGEERPGDDRPDKTLGRME